MRATWILGFSAILALAVVPVSAQPVVAAKSGTISVADGKVFLDEKPLELQPGQFPDMKEKSTLRTEDGRAEVLLPPGMFLRLGENGSFRMVSNRLIDTRLELLTGSAVVEIDATSKDAQVTLLSKDGTVTFTKGIYRFDAQPARVKVFEGSASVEVGGRTLAVSSGRMMGLTGDTASVEKFDIKDTDSLDHWSRRRGEEVAVANVSAAKRAYDTSWNNSINPCLGNGYYGNFAGQGYPLGNATLVNSGLGMGTGLGMGSGLGMGGGYMGYGLGYGAWAYNPYYGMVTYMPCSGMFVSPYGYNYWSPYTVGRMYYNPGGFGRTGGLLGGGTSRGLGYSNPGNTGLGVTKGGTFVHGYSGVVGASSSSGSGFASSAPVLGGSSGGGFGSAGAASGGTGGSMGHATGGAGGARGR
jgi:hypothetical protein